MLFRIPGRRLVGSRFFHSHRVAVHQHSSLFSIHSPPSSAESRNKILDHCYHQPGARAEYHIRLYSRSTIEPTDVQDPVDPFSLVVDDLSHIDEKLRLMLDSEVPEMALAAQYFFRDGIQGKKTCPTVLLLIVTAFKSHLTDASLDDLDDVFTVEQHERQHLVAEITEIFHVASLIHDDVLDDAVTRRGVGSLNHVMGTKVAVLAGDFMLSRALVALASLKNAEVISLFATAFENLVTGEIMQMTATSEKSCSMEFYMQKTYNKTAALISNSCKAIALISGQTAETASLAFEYGKHLGLAYQLIDDILDFTGTSTSLGKGSLSDIKQGIITAPILFAMEEFPQLKEVVNNGFHDPVNVEIVIEYLNKSSGVQRTRELALKHSKLAAQAIDSLPETLDENAIKMRRALVYLTQRIITRKK